MKEEESFVTIHDLAVSSQGLLRLSGGILQMMKNSATWDLDDYTRRAQDFGDAKLMYEPLRATLSPARRTFETAIFSQTINQSTAEQLKNIIFLAEIARSEIYLQHPQDILDLCDRPIPKLLYFALENPRYTPTIIRVLAEGENMLARIHGRDAFPTRVYEPRSEIGLPLPIQEKKLKQKILPLSGTVVETALKDTQYAKDQLERAMYMVRIIQNALSLYDIVGIELSVLMIHTLFDGQSSSELLRSFIKELFSARSKKDPHLSFVQSITIQPLRPDLRHTVEYAQMESLIDLIAAQGFAGTVIYAPGGGDAEKDARDLVEKFHIGTKEKS